MNLTEFCFISLALLVIFGLSFKAYVMYQGSNGLLVVHGRRSFVVCRYTACDFLGPWVPQILDRWGQVFLADGDEIRLLRKRELRTQLSEDELRQFEHRLGLYNKVCVIRKHELTSRAQERIARDEALRGNWPKFPKSPDGRKDDIIVSPL